MTELSLYVLNALMIVFLKLNLQLFFSYGTHVREVNHLPPSSRGDTITNSTSCSAGKVIIEKSRGEVSLIMEQDTIENVS